MTQQATAMRALGLSPRLSGELLAIVSHDLRTPLSTIALGTTLLEDASQGQEDRTQASELSSRPPDGWEALFKVPRGRGGPVPGGSRAWAPGAWGRGRPRRDAAAALTA